MKKNRFEWNLGRRIKDKLRRVLSGTLAAVMLASLLPAGLIVPAHAIKGLTLTIDSIDPDTGAYSVTVTGSSAANGRDPGKWALALVPTEAGSGGMTVDAIISAGGISASATQSKAAMASALSLIHI